MVTGKPFANDGNGDSRKAIVGAVFVYEIGMRRYLTSRRNYMPGKEFGTAVFENTKQVSKELADKDEGKNRILSQNIRMSMDTRKTRLNLNFLVIGGSGAGKSATRS